MGFSIGKIFRSATKPIKKVLKSPIGKLAALGLGAYYGPKMFGVDKGFGNWGAALGNFKNLPAWKQAGLVGLGTTGASLVGSEMEEEEEEVISDDTAGHEAYLKYRKYFPFGSEDPMFNQGGRVKANIGLYAGPQGGMNQRMNPQMNRGINPQMNRGIGAMNPLGMGSPHSSMMNVDRPLVDPRSAQMKGIENALVSAKPPSKSQDVELIQLIKMLTSMGIPMEQLRGRTKEELVELLVSVKGRGGQKEVVEEAEVVEANRGGLMRTGYAIGSAPTDTVVEESENIELAGTDTPAEDMESLQELRDSFFDVHGREPINMEELKLFLRIRRQATNKGGLMRTGYAMGTSQFGLMGNEHPVIPSKDGNQLDMRQTGGYQPHGKAEKHDDVRALLAQGEFVMTSDAVKGMGGGDRELGAKKMYDLMHNMEAMA